MKKETSKKTLASFEWLLIPEWDTTSHEVEVLILKKVSFVLC